MFKITTVLLTRFNYENLDWLEKVCLCWYPHSKVPSPKFCKMLYNIAEAEA